MHNVDGIVDIFTQECHREIYDEASSLLHAGRIFDTEYLEQRLHDL